MPIVIIIDHQAWENEGLVPVAMHVFNSVMRYFGYDPVRFEVSLLACDDSRISSLNQQFRSKKTATNVLSWPSVERAPASAGEVPRALDPQRDGFLGDIALAYETCCAEAQSRAKPLSDHINHLLIHGLLHLMGFDHEDDADATVMESIETEILGKMGINAPYIDYE